MEFGETLKAGLNEVPGTGFTNRLRQNVLDAVSETRPRRGRRVQPWSVLTAAAAVCVVIGAWAVYQNQGGRITTSAERGNGTPLNQTNPISQPSAPARVSITAGIGDTLDVLKQEYGTPSLVSRPPATSPVEYDFANHISAWVQDGRVVEIHRTFTGGQMHSCDQVVFAMTPKDSVLQRNGPQSKGNTTVFTYQSASLAKALRNDAFGTATPGTYRVVTTQNAFSVDAAIVLGDVTVNPFVQRSSDGTP